jgi:hypothetical protein
VLSYGISIVLVVYKRLKTVACKSMIMFALS